ncbi:hypothetical protein Q8A73_017382 [Channa argus]|nr:hypothetical protein Q8A73_017382 [Channa argus]
MLAMHVRECWGGAHPQGEYSGAQKPCTSLQQQIIEVLRRRGQPAPAERQTAGLPLIHLAGGEFGLRQVGQPTDLWVKFLTALGRQPVWANDGARMTEAIGL